MSSSKIIIALFLVLLFAAVAVRLAGPPVENPEIDFTAMTEFGEKDLSSYMGKPLLLYFFTTWDPFSREDLKNARSAYLKYAGKVNFVLVDMDLGEDMEKIKQYKKENAILGVFMQGNAMALGQFKTQVVTAKFLINKTGSVINETKGVLSEKEWEKLFENLSGL